MQSNTVFIARPAPTLYGVRPTEFNFHLSQIKQFPNSHIYGMPRQTYGKYSEAFQQFQVNLMISIRIGQEERSLDAVDEQWVNQQIIRRRHDGQSDCVTVRIHQQGELDLALTTPSCGGGGGGGRPPNAKESEVIDLWQKRRLNEPNFTGGDLVAFLRQLKRLL